MAEYALSVFSVIVLSVIAEIMLTGVKTKKVARFAFSLIVTATLITPVIKLFFGEYEFSSISEYEISIDDDFSEYVFGLAKKRYESDIFELVKNSGHDYIEEVVCTFSEDENKLSFVEIKCDFSGISGEKAHTYISEIERLVEENYNLSKGVVSVSGG